MRDELAPFNCRSCETPTQIIRSETARRDQEPVGYVHSVETCGTVDGPGLRYVLFLSGCPLRCAYCHNPDAQGKPRGFPQTAHDALQDVIRYRNFIRQGGLTVSGGEPLLQSAFVTALFVGAQQAGMHTALDTSGFRGDLAPRTLLEHTDLVLLDIKSWDPATYRRVTGVAIDSTLAFARRLQRWRIPTWIRFVLVPGLTDDERNLEGLAKFVASLENVERAQILPFHQMARRKYAQLGIEYQLEFTPTPTSEQIQQATEIFARHGVRIDDPR